MICNKCNHIVNDDSNFCPNCGNIINELTENLIHAPIYTLSPNNQRAYCITVNREKFHIEGTFWHLQDKEFVKSKIQKDDATLKNFIGMGYLSKRSYKKCITFILAGSVLELVKTIVDKLTEWIDNANTYLQWIDRSISLPEWVSYLMNTIAGICVLLAIIFFFSKKKMIEISFLDKRICVPEKSLSQSEYNLLYQSIANASKR